MTDEGGAQASRIDPRIVVHYLSLPSGTPVPEALGMVQSAGLNRIGLPRTAIDESGWETTVAAVRESGIEVVYLSHKSMFTLDADDEWPQERAALRRTVQMAQDLGAGLVYGTTGPAGRLTPDAAELRFVEAVRPLLADAADLSVRLMIESTNPQFADIDILHSLRDSVRVARAAGVGLVVDLHPIWTEFGLAQLLSEVSAWAGMVQISDYVPGTRSVYRSIPGDGVIPIQTLLTLMLDNGFSGPIDLELIGSNSGVEDIRRAATHVTGLIQKVRPRSNSDS
jgi:sugar phosphate isomerase/epimerase